MISILEFGFYIRDFKYYKQYISKNLKFLDKINNIDDKVVVLRDYVRGRIKTVSHGKFYNVNKRPFLRHTARETLIYEEGQCGEGTRVIINLLMAEGIKARRVYLCGSGAHVALEYFNGERWIFLDSINSPEWFYKATTKEKMPVQEFFSYNKKIGCIIPPYKYGPTFTNYSYFWIPKLIPASAGIMAYLHKPFPYLFTIIYENPPLLLSLIYLLFAVLSGLIWFFLRIRD